MKGAGRRGPKARSPFPPEVTRSIDAHLEESKASRINDRIPVPAGIHQLRAIVAGIEAVEAKAGADPKQRAKRRLKLLGISKKQAWRAVDPEASQKRLQALSELEAAPSGSSETVLAARSALLIALGDLHRMLSLVEAGAAPSEVQIRNAPFSLVAFQPGSLEDHLEGLVRLYAREVERALRLLDERKLEEALSVACSALCELARLLESTARGIKHEDDDKSRALGSSLAGTGRPGPLSRELRARIKRVLPKILTEYPKAKSRVIADKLAGKLAHDEKWDMPSEEVLTEFVRRFRRRNSPTKG